MNALTRFAARCHTQAVYWTTWLWRQPTPTEAVPHVGATEDGPRLAADAPDVDEWTTDIELYLRDVAELADIERRHRQRLDDWWPTVLARLDVTELDLQAHDGWAGVHDLVEVG